MQQERFTIFKPMQYHDYDLRFFAFFILFFGIFIPYFSTNRKDFRLIFTGPNHECNSSRSQCWGRYRSWPSSNKCRNSHTIWCGLDYMESILSWIWSNKRGASIMFMRNVEGFFGMAIYGMTAVVVGATLFVTLDQFGERMITAVRNKV